MQCHNFRSIANQIVILYKLVCGVVSRVTGGQMATPAARVPRASQRRLRRLAGATNSARLRCDRLRYRWLQLRYRPPFSGKCFILLPCCRIDTTHEGLRDFSTFVQTAIIMYRLSIFETYPHVKRLLLNVYNNIVIHIFYFL